MLYLDISKASGQLQNLQIAL